MLATLPVAPEALPTFTAEPVIPDHAPTPEPPPADVKPPVTTTDKDTLLGAIFSKKDEPTPEPDKVPDAPASELEDEDLKGFKMGKKEQEAFTHRNQKIREQKRLIKELEVKAAEADALRSEATKAKADLDAAKANPETTTRELADLRSKYEEAQKELSVSRIEATDLYKREVSGPKKAVEETIEQIATDNEIAVRDIYAALNAKTSKERAKALSDIGASLTDFEKSKLFQSAEALAAIEARADQFRSEAKTRLEAIEVERKALTDKTSSISTEEWHKAADSAWAQLTEEAPFFKEEDGNAKWNEGVTGIREFVKNTNFSKDFDTPTQAVAMARVAAFPTLLTIANNLRMQRDSLRDKLTKVSSKQPDLGDSPPPPNSTEKEPESLVELISRARK
jgi:hypothetical protein